MMKIKIESDTLVVGVWLDRAEKGEPEQLEELYGPFGGWDEARDFANQLGLDDDSPHQIHIQILRNPEISSTFPVTFE